MSPRPLHEQIAETMKRRPDATAVVMGNQRLSYAELDRVADRLARALLDRGCLPGDRVSLMAPKAPVTVAAMLATLRAGCVYVPVDVSGPVSRSARIVSRAEPSAVCVLDEGATLMQALVADGALDAQLPVIDLDAGPASAETVSKPLTPRPVTLSDPMHLLFTSGSTGQPKGVVVTHASMCAFIEWAIAEFDIQPGDRCSGHAPLHFDLSMFDVYATLVAGGELHLLPPRTVLPRQLADYISTSQLDQLFCVPSVMTYLAGAGAIPAGGFPSLRRILWCGEVLPTAILIDWMSRHPHSRFTNLYGPTEATIASSHHTIHAVPPDPSQPIPIGTACDGEELVILGDYDVPVEAGVTGELCIAGVGLSPGYWRDPETTKRAFVPDPRPGRGGQRIYRTGDLAWHEDRGTVHFVGRRDSQIKHRGHRIELGEIEAAVAGLGIVAECSVVAIATDGFEGTLICCAAVPRAGAPAPTPVSLRTALIGQLPGYMLPGRWLLVDALPKNVNGKIDRREVRSRFEALIVGPSSRPGEDGPATLSRSRATCPS